jgi:hypothetical protein
MRRSSPTVLRTPDPDVVLTRALLRAAAILGLAQKDIARIIGVSPASMSRVGSGERRLQAESKEGECALLLIRIFRGLDALLGGKEEAVRQWFHAPNVHIGGVPAARVQTIEGLVHVAEYLDAMRGKQHGVEAFVYLSARDPGGGKNLGLFAPVFARSRPTAPATWVCTASRQQVELSKKDLFRRQRFAFQRADFEVDGILPAPAL